MKHAVAFIFMLGFLTSLFGQKTPDDLPPTPRWKPTVPIDLPVIAERATYYTDHQKTIVIFKNGTCVVLPADIIKPDEEAKTVLDKVYNYHPDFNPQAMDDGNFVVSYSQSNCFSIVTKAEFLKNQEYIQNNHLDGLVKNEVLLNAEKKPNVFDERGMIGLFARARMFMDAQKPKIVKILRPPTTK
jgi:hypothetical protein